MVYYSNIPKPWFIVLTIVSHITLANSGSAQEMPDNEKRRFLALMENCNSYDVFQEARWLYGLYPEDRILAKALSTLSESFKGVADKQFAVTAAFGSGNKLNIFGQTIHPYGSQVFHLSKTIEKKWIAKHSNNGYSITSIAGNQSCWFTVMSRMRDGSRPYNDQNEDWFYGEGEEMQTFVGSAWENGRKLTHVAESGGKWWLVTGEVPDWGAQRFTCKARWPKKWITDRNKEGYVITSLTSGIDPWNNSSKYFIVMSKVRKSLPTVLVSNRDYGKWIGENHEGGQWVIRGGFYQSREEPGWNYLLHAPSHSAGAWRFLRDDPDQISNAIIEMRNGTLIK